MSNTSNTIEQSPPTSDWESLTLHCEGHLRDELSAAETTLRGLQRVREALLLADGERLQEALASQQADLAAAEQMRARRGDLRPRLGAALGVPADQATISRLLERLGPRGAAIAGLRESLQRIATEVTRHAAGNAALIRGQSRLLDEILRSLHGEVVEEEETRYGNHGQKARGAPRPAVEARL